MKPLHSLPLFLSLLLATAAWAEPIRGRVEVVQEAAPTARSPERVIDVVFLHSQGTAYRITDRELVSTLMWLEREEVVVDAKVREGTNDLTVARIVEPKQCELRGVAFRTSKGWGGAPKIEVGGRAVEVRGPNYLTLLKLTKDMKRREIEFRAYPFWDAAGRLQKLVVTQIKARAKEDLVLTETVLAYQGSVPAGSTVWIQRRSLIGISARVRASDGTVGFALWDRLQIGAVVEDEPAKAKGARAGITDVLNR